MNLTMTRGLIATGGITASALVAASVVAFSIGHPDETRLTAAPTTQSAAPTTESAAPTSDPLPSEIPTVPAETPTAAPVEAPAAPAPAPQTKKAATGGTTGQVAAGPNVNTAAAPNWRLTFSEDFNGSVGIGGFSSAYGSKFWTYSGNDTFGYGKYATDKVVSVVGGNLDMFIHSENGQPYSAAIVPNIPGQTYGRYSVTFRADSMPGYGAAFLLWPDSNNWNEGEIDFPEAPFDGYLSLHDHCVGHTQDSCYNVETTTSWANWHTATTEWTSGQVTFYLDGVQIGQSNVSPSSPMHMVIQTGTERAAPNPAVQGHLQIGSISIWALA